jgi:glycosyltransferase involved in cell wall biosynthesis
MPMRIAIISTPAVASWGGSEELWAAMALEALRAGHSVTISPRHDLYDRSHKLRYLATEGARILEKPFPSKRIGLAANEQRYGRHYEALFMPKPDVVLVSNGGGYNGLFSQSLISALNRLAVPYVVSCRLVYESGFIGEEHNQSAEGLLGNACRVVFPSHRNLLIAERHLARHLPHGAVLHSPVKLNGCRLIEWPRSEGVYLANVARLEPIQKGQDILFEVLHSPRWMRRKWLLRLYGSGRSRGYLEKLAKHYGIGNRVQFMGFIESIESIWAQNELLALPSRDEGAPIALIEAMLCGRPSVVTDVGGNAEWVQDGISGFVAEAPNVKSFDSALEKAWEAKRQWKQIGKVALETAWSKYDKNPGAALLNILTDCAL